MNLIRVGWVVVASIVRVSLGQEERLIDCSGFDLDGPSLRTTVAGVDDPLGREQVIDPQIELNFLVQLDGQLQNPFSEPISSQLDLNLALIVQHPGGTLEVEDTASVVLDGGPIAPGQFVGFKIDGQDLVRQLNGSAVITDLGGIARLYADAISIRVAGEVSLFSAAGGVVSLIEANVTEGVVRLSWEQMTNNAIRGWNQTAPATWFSDQHWSPFGVPTFSQTAIFGSINEMGAAEGNPQDVASLTQVDVSRGSFLFDRDLEVNANRLRVGLNQDNISTSLELRSSSLSLADASAGAPQSGFSSLRVFPDSILTASRLDIGVAGSAELVLKESVVQAERLRVGYAPIDALNAYDGQLQLGSNVALGGGLFELQGDLKLVGDVSPMQFSAFVVDDLGKAAFPGNVGEVDNRGLLKVAGGGALISGNYTQAGEDERASGRLQTGLTPSDVELSRLEVEGQAQLAGGLEIVWPDGATPTSSEVLVASSIVGEFPIRHFIGGDGTSAVAFTVENGLGAQVLRLENAGAADPLPLVFSTGFDFPSGFRDIEIGDINNDGLSDVAAVVLGAQGLPEVELQLAQMDADTNQLDFVKVSVDVPLDATDITFGDANFDQLPDLCVAGLEGTFAIAAATEDGSFEPFQVVLGGYGEVADIRAFSAPSDPLDVRLLDATNSRLRRIQAVNTFLGSGFSDQDEGGTDDDPSEIDPVPGTGKKNDNAVITSLGSVSSSTGSGKKKSRGNNDTGSSGTGDPSSPLALVSTPAIHVTLHRDRKSFEVHRLTAGGELGGGVEFMLSAPDAEDEQIPIDLELGDFDGDGDSDIAVAFVSNGSEDLSQGAVLLLRADWDGSGGVTFVDTPLQASGTPIVGVRSGDFDADGVDELLLFRESPFFIGDGLVVEVLRRSATIGDVNGDGQVGFADLLLVLARWGEVCGDCPEDLSGNGVVDFDDVLALLTNWSGTP